MPDPGRNRILFKWDNFFAGLWLMAAVLSVYFQDITHSYAQTMSVFSVCGLSQAVLEIPTGVFSDKIGRRQTLILSAASILVCLLLWAAAGQFHCVPFLFAGAVLYGASDALMSGTVDALMFETMQAMGERQDFRLVYASGRGYNQAGLLISVLIAAVVMYVWPIQILAWISVLPMIGQLIIAFFYVNPSVKTKNGAGDHDFKQAFSVMWRNKNLRLFSVIEILDSSLCMTLHRFEGIYFKNLVAVWIINLIRGCKHLAGMIGYALVKRFRRIRSLKLLAGSVLWSVCAESVGLLLNSIVSPFVMALSNLSFGITETSKTELLQNEFLVDQRATMGSILSLLTAVFQAVVYVSAGALADCFGVRCAIVCLICSRVIVVFLCRGKNGKRV